MELNEIVAAVDAGRTVCWSHDGYEVQRTSDKPGALGMDVRCLQLPRPTMRIWVDECPYCGQGPCRGSARSTGGHDIDRFHAIHPRQRAIAFVATPDTRDWPRTPYCDGQRAAILDPYVRHAVGLSGGVLDDGAGEWYAGFDDALVGRFYGATP